jgi:peptide deformylase
MIRPLVYYGDSRLRKKCQRVETISPDVEKLAADLIESVEAYHGAGLAAPQIGELVQMFVITYTGTDEEGAPIMGDPEIYINPRIVSYSDEKITIEEGCLSVPGLRAPVERSVSIKIESQRLDGSLREETVDGWRARVILHEYDHLNGSLFIDRTSKKMRNILDAGLRSIKKKYNAST